jgi:RimJ/RimL family protein N-acetyltransferase
VDDILTEHWIGWEPPSDIAETKEQVFAAVERTKQLPNVECVAFGAAGEFVGRCDISPCVFNRSAGDAEYELNVWVKRFEQGKGYGKEMSVALVEWAKKNTDLPYLVYSVTKGNVASERIAAGLHPSVLREFPAVKRGEERGVYPHMGHTQPS